MKRARQRKNELRQRVGEHAGKVGGNDNGRVLAFEAGTAVGREVKGHGTAVEINPLVTPISPNTLPRIGAEVVDPDVRSGVNTPAGEGAAMTQAATAPSIAMEQEHFGTFLRRARESRDLVLADVAQKTKVARSTLELLERGQLAELPAGVYVRGFIRSFARAVGTDETEPLLMYERAVEAKSRAEKARDVTPVAELPVPMGPHADDEAMAPRRGLGLAVFVIILLLIATITLSLLLRRPPPSGEGLSLAPALELPVPAPTPPA
jgi:transcriptional regulator with XRE-family HTH domain